MTKVFKCIELNKTFATKEELFRALRKNAKRIISLKCAAIYKSAEKGQFSPIASRVKVDETAKAIFNFKENYIYPVINTTNFLDTHLDVHQNGIWSKTKKESQGRVFYVMNHSLTPKDVIAWTENVKILTKMIPWSLLGKEYEGETQALIYEIATENIVNDYANKMIEEKRPVQGSVRMRYIEVSLAINSEEEEDKKYKKTFDKVFPLIANKGDFEEDSINYFWSVTEAKNEREGSMVLLGSNEATPILSLEDTQEPNKFTLEDEPLKDTHQKTKEITDLLIKKFNDEKQI